MVGFHMKEIIIQEAINLYRIKGLSLTMNDIAQSLHIAKKTIYKYFDSKESLLQGVVEYGFALIQQKKRQILSSDLAYIEKLSQLLIAMPTEIASIDLKQLESLSTQYPAVFASINHHLKSDWEPVYAFIQQGIDAHILRDIPLYMIEIIITSSMNSLLSNSDDTHTYQQSLQDLLDILMKGMIL